MTIQEFLTTNGFGYTYNDGVVTLTGDWISPFDDDVFMSDATVEAVENYNPAELTGVVKITDADGTRLVELYKGNGANGSIRDWQEWLDSLDLGVLSSQQAVALVGAATVRAADEKACDYTGRLLPDPDSRVEFGASVACPAESDYSTLTAIYYQDKEDLDACEDGDLGGLNWTVDHYALT